MIPISEGESDWPAEAEGKRGVYQARTGCPDGDSFGPLVANLRLSMRTQTYANHRTIPPVYLVAGVAILTWAGYNLYYAVLNPSCGAWLAAVGTTALLPVWFAARRNSQKMQDRIIRLEMEVRLARLLPGRDLAALTLGQLVALRFASDREMPALRTGSRIYWKRVSPLLFRALQTARFRRLGRRRVCDRERDRDSVGQGY